MMDAQPTFCHRAKISIQRKPAGGGGTAPPGLPFRFDSATVKRGLNFTLSTALGALDTLGEVTGGGNYQALIPHTNSVELFGVTCHLASLAGHPLDLTPIEFNLLRLLATDAGRAFTRQSLLDLVWGEDYAGTERLMDTHIQHLRRRLSLVDSGYHPITSVRGLGYRFQN
jgi:hypothetical protein